MHSDSCEMISKLLDQIGLTAELVTDMPSFPEGEIPNWWTAVFSGSADPRDAVLSQWERYTDVLPQSVGLLGELLRHVCVVKYRGAVRIAYAVGSENDLFLYEGGNPRIAQIPHRLEPAFRNLPDRLQTFYTEFHNGFGFLPGYSVGLLPVEQLFLLSDEDWGWLENSDADPSSYSLATKLVVLSNGGGGYLCVDTADKIMDENPETMIWWKDGPPDHDRFWNVLDAWMAIGLES